MAKPVKKGAVTKKKAAAKKASSSSTSTKTSTARKKAPKKIAKPSSISKTGRKSSKGKSVSWKNDDDDINEIEYLRSDEFLADLERDVVDAELEGLDETVLGYVKTSSGVTARYRKVRRKVYRDFIESLKSNSKLRTLAILYPKDSRKADVHIEKIMIVCSGPVTRLKVNILNKCLVNYALHLKKRPKDGKQVRLQPSSTMTKLRILFSEFRLEYDIQMSLFSDFKGFDGCLAGVLGDVWNDEYKKDSTYRSRPTKVDWTDREDLMVCNYVTSAKLDLRDDVYLVLNYALGRYAFFRGRDEHANLKWDMIEWGQYGPYHAAFANMPWVRIHLLDKTHKLNMSTFCLSMYFCQ